MSLPENETVILQLGTMSAPASGRVILHPGGDNYLQDPLVGLIVSAVIMAVLISITLLSLLIVPLLKKRYGNQDREDAPIVPNEVISLDSLPSTSLPPNSCSQIQNYKRYSDYDYPRKIPAPVFIMFDRRP